MRIKILLAVSLSIFCLACNSSRFGQIKKYDGKMDTLDTLASEQSLKDLLEIQGLLENPNGRTVVKTDSTDQTLVTMVAARNGAISYELRYRPADKRTTVLVFAAYHSGSLAPADMREKVYDVNGDGAIDSYSAFGRNKYPCGPSYQADCYQKHFAAIVHSVAEEIRVLETK